MQISVILAALFASVALAVPAVTVNEAAAIFDRAVNAGRPIAEGACCIAGKNKKGDKCENKGKAGVCAVADTAGCKCPFAFARPGGYTDANMYHRQQGIDLRLGN
jgi:hypothetical protein